MADCEIIDIKFPTPVVFTQGHGRYLRVRMRGTNALDAAGILEFTGAKDEDESKFEVIPQADGFVAIKSLHNNKYCKGDAYYWIVMNDSMITHIEAITDITLAQANKKANANGGALIMARDDTVDQYALFKPFMFGDQQVVFFHKHTKKFCNLFDQDDWLNLYGAQTDRVEECCKLTVEEPVLRRSITNVVYKMDEWVSKNEAVTLDEQVITNDSDRIADGQFNANYPYKKIYGFDRSISVMTGVDTTIETTIPCLSRSGIRFSELVTRTLKWGEMKEENATYTYANVRKHMNPGRRVKFTLYGEKVVAKVPFEYRKIDYITEDTVDMTDWDDGLFCSVNVYPTAVNLVNL